VAALVPSCAFGVALVAIRLDQNQRHVITDLPKKPFAEDKECVPEHRTMRCELACSAFKAIAAFN
jgi:hypothetical protein